MPDPTEIENVEQAKPEEVSLVDMIVNDLGAKEEGAPEESAEAEAKPEGEAAAVVPPGDADPAKKEAEKPPVAGEDAADAEKAKNDKAVEDELKTLGITNEKSQARFRELANEAAEGRAVKTQLAEVQKIADQQNQVFEQLDSHGVTGDQFGLMVAVAGDVNSGDPAREKRAYDHLMAEATALAKKLGIEAPGFDPVAAHPDLAKEVAEGAIDRARALELAHHRQVRVAGEQHQQTRNQQDQQQAAVRAGQQSLDALEQELKARDPQYAQKRAILLPSLKAAFPNVPPAQWAQEFAKAYQALVLPAPASVQPQSRPDPNSNGRPNGAAGQAAPKNAAEAVMLAMGITPET